MLKRSSVVAVALASVSWLAMSAGTASAETLQEALALAGILRLTFEGDIHARRQLRFR